MQAVLGRLEDVLSHPTRALLGCQSDTISKPNQIYRDVKCIVSSSSAWSWARIVSASILVVARLLECQVDFSICCPESTDRDHTVLSIQSFPRKNWTGIVVVLVSHLSYLTRPVERSSCRSAERLTYGNLRPQLWLVQGLMLSSSWHCKKRRGRQFESDVQMSTLTLVLQNL